MRRDRIGGRQMGLPPKLFPSTKVKYKDRAGHIYPESSWYHTTKPQ